MRQQLILRAVADPDFYKSVMSVPSVEPIYETLKELKLGVSTSKLPTWLFPKIGDSMDRIREMAKWIKNYLGPDTPFHLLRFHPEYKLTTVSATSVQDMERAYMTAKNEGLNYVYMGNVPGHPAENTYCPNCDTAVIKRDSLRYHQLEPHRRHEMPRMRTTNPHKRQTTPKQPTLPLCAFLASHQ